ncbi:MAG: adenylate kinase [Ruminococcaceae bacterium]|nr:adenylate kinase [Oscillospiraceae bacterium]
MQKVIVIGCPGSGKSTFSRALSKKMGLPLYHLDLMKWNADKTTVERPVFLERLSAVLPLEKWIIDGNYGSTMEWRMEHCDTVFFLDFSTEDCLDGIEMRMGKERPDMPWVEMEHDKEFEDYVRAFNTVQRPSILELLEKYKEKDIIILKNRAQVDEYLDLY